MSSKRYTAAGLAVLSGALVLAGGAWAQFGPQSTAVGVQATFTSQGVGTQLGPVANVDGQPSGRYNVSTTVAKATETVIASPLLTRPTVSLSAANLTSHASASGIGVDSRSSEADAAVGDATVRLFTNPPAGSGLPSVLYLAMNAKEALSSANFSQVVPANNYASGSTQIGLLTVTGELLGGATVRYYGPASPNTVVYESPTVTITLNREMKTGIITCSPGCKFTPVRIDVAAVDVELHNAVVGGAKLSGHILVGDNTAQ
jgi:hypothetical protein